MHASDYNWVKARGDAIRADAIANGPAWAAQQLATPQVQMSYQPASTTAGGTTALTANVVGGPSGLPTDSPTITFTVTSPDGLVNGQHAVTVPLVGRTASVTVTSVNPANVTVSATTTLNGLVGRELVPNISSQVLILSQPLPVTGTGSASVAFAAAPNLVVHKAVSDNGSANGGDNGTPLPAKPGDTLKYTISYQNTGTAATSGTTIADPLSQGTLALLDINKVVPGENGVLDKTARTITWNVGPVASGASGEVDFTAVLPTSMNDNGSGVDFCNVGQVIPGGTGPGTGVVNTNAACVHATTQAQVVVVKVVDTTIAALGQTLHYTVQLSNNGTRNLTNVDVVDPLNTGNLAFLDDVVPGNGGVWDAKTRTIHWTVADLAVGQQTAVGFTAMVPAGGLPHGVNSCFTNVASAQGGNLGGVFNSPPVTTCVNPAVCVQPTPAVQISGPAAMFPGGTGEYVVKIINSGETINPTTAAVSIPNGMTITAVSTGGVISGGQAAWNLGQMAPGSSATLTVDVVAASTGLSGFWQVTAAVTGTGNLPDCPPAQATLTDPITTQVAQAASGVLGISTPDTGISGSGLLRSGFVGLCLILSGAIILTAPRRRPFRLPGR